jgi:uncharacterized protein (TIGR04255 family)
MRLTGDPLTAPPPAEVHLPLAPLVRVVAQLRFPDILSVEQPEFVAPFQETIRSEYPVLRREQTFAVLVGPGGATQAKPQSAWRLSSADGLWRVSPTPEFLALETTKYQSRGDFLARLRLVVDALNLHIRPSQIDRLGVRYIDRIVGTELTDLGDLVRPEVLGIATTGASALMTLSLTETRFELSGTAMVARWGTMPPGTTYDPATLEAASASSWILDLDMFNLAAIPSDTDRVIAEAAGYAARIYAVFRWVVKDAFLRRYGGSP